MNSWDANEKSVFYVVVCISNVFYVFVTIHCLSFWLPRLLFVLFSIYLLIEERFFAEKTVHQLNYVMMSDLITWILSCPKTINSRKNVFKNVYKHLDDARKVKIKIKCSTKYGTTKYQTKY